MEIVFDTQQCGKKRRYGAQRLGKRKIKLKIKKK
jgi:hypothetical protein